MRVQHLWLTALSGSWTRGSMGGADRKAETDPGR
jgi:hypothetical protein